MKAHVSPLKCHGYYLTELAVTANPSHQPDQPVRLELPDLSVESSTERVREETGKDVWRVALHVRQHVGSEKNAPYNFSLSLIGGFEAHPGFPTDKVQELVEVNGSSILYGAARQILRQAMSNGPYISLLLPSVSFAPQRDSKGSNVVAESGSVYGDHD